MTQFGEDAILRGYLPGVRRGRYYCAFLIDPDGNNVEAGVYADE